MASAAAMASAAMAKHPIPPLSPPPPSDSVHISGLPSDQSQQHLFQGFSAYGEVRALEYVPSQGTAVVQFAERDQAQWVVEHLNGNNVHFLSCPTRLSVSYMEHHGLDASAVPAQSESVFVYGLPFDKDEGALVDGFSQFKAVKALQVIPGQGSNGALIEFHTREDAKFMVDTLHDRIPHFLTEPIQVLYATATNYGASCIGDQQADGAKTSRFSKDAPAKTTSRPNLAAGIPTPCRRAAAGPRAASASRPGGGCASAPALCAVAGPAPEVALAWKRVESQRNRGLFFYYKGSELPAQWLMDSAMAEAPEALRTQELRALGRQEFPQARHCLDEVLVR